MNALLLILMIGLIFPNQAFAKEESKIGTPTEAIGVGSSADYSEFSSALVLVDDPANSDRNKAFLAIDKNGRPAIYPVLEREQRCAALSQHSLKDILAHWTPAKVDGDVYSFSFLVPAHGAWIPARIDLRFRENYCSQFRVVSEATKIQSWLSAGAIPREVDRPSTNGKLKLPLFIGIVEGPRDTSDCRMGPISDRYSKALEEGKCPLRFRSGAIGDNFNNTEEDKNR
jgi:hypothetical protein